MQSFHLAKAALVPMQGTIDEAYYRKQMTVVEERLALAGVEVLEVIDGLDE